MLGAEIAAPTRQVLWLELPPVRGRTLERKLQRIRQAQRQAVLGQPAHADYLAKETGIDFIEAVNHFEANAQRDGLVDCHGHLRTIANTLFNVANNILKAYGTDQVDIEIVAFGPGLRLLFEDNNNTGRIDGLVNSGVRFFACQNTINNMSNILGTPVKVNSHASSGKGGIVRIKELVDQGYMLAKP